MTDSVHASLTGSDLHESKGVATALSGEVYVADGAGSGVWTPAASVVTNTAFSTGDLKATHKAAADPSWILWTNGTIGDGSSGATARANADTQALFFLYWNSYTNTNCPVTGGRGVSASADFAAHKVIGIPLAAGRVVGVAGVSTGLTARTIGTFTGAEVIALSTTNLPPYTPTGAITNGAINISHNANVEGFAGVTGGGSFSCPTGALASITAGQNQSTFSGNAQGGHSTPFSVMQPTIFINWMIKL